MNYDELANSLKILGGVLSVLAVIVALVIIWLQIESGKVKDAKAKIQEEKIAELNLKVIEAETKLLDLRSRILWRYFDHNKFINILKNKDRGNVEIVYFKDDNETYMLAEAIWMALEVCGWNVQRPVTGMNDDPKGHLIPFDMREGGIIMSNQARIIISVSESLERKPYNKNTPLSGLLLAFETCGVQFIQTIPHEGIRPSKGTVRIVVGSRL